MKAVVFCNSHKPLPQVLGEQMEFAMLSVASRPIAWRIVEMCAQAGLSHIYFVAEELPDKLRDVLGSGKRWGVRVEVVTPVGAPLETVNSLASAEEPVLVLPGLCLCPPGDLGKLIESWESKTLKLGKRGEGPVICKPREFEGAYDVLVPEGPLYCLTSVADIFTVTHQSLDGAFPWFVYDEKESGAGIHIGHHCTIHPSAEIIAPVRIGQYTSIGADSVIGPYAAIGENCILDDRVEVSHSIMEAGSYAGPMTYRKNIVAVQRSVLTMPDETCVWVPDEFLQKSMVDIRKDVGSNAVHRLGALVLIILLSPVLLLLWVAGGFAYKTREIAGRETLETLDCESQIPVVRIHEANTDFPLFKRLLLLPALLDVLSGKLRLIGPEPVFPEQGSEYVQDWERQRFAMLPGIIPPWVGLADAPLHEVEKRTINTWYVHHAGVKTDWKVLWGMLLRGWRHL